MEKLLSLLERQGISIEKKNVVLAQLKKEIVNNWYLEHKLMW